MPNKICSVEWCDRPVHGNGLCSKHCQQMWKNGKITPKRVFVDLPDEEWKTIPGFDGMYQISNFGRVRSYKGTHGGREDIPKLMKEHLNTKRYNQLGFCYKGKMKRILVHRLVAEAFIPNPENKPFINHKDGVRSHNHIDNLEWVTQSENMRHSYDVLKQPLPPGTPKSIRCVETGKTYKSAADAQRDTGVSKANIGKVALAKGTGGRRLGHTNLTAGGYHWEFVN